MRLKFRLRLRVTMAKISLTRRVSHSFLAQRYRDHTLDTASRLERDRNRVGCVYLKYLLKKTHTNIYVWAPIDHIVRSKYIYYKHIWLKST